MDHSKNSLRVGKKRGRKMKKTLFILLIAMFMVIPFVLNAEQKTLVKSDVDSGWYCRPVLLKLTTIDGGLAGLGGIGGNWMIAHRVTLGASAYWLMTPVETDVSGAAHEIEFDYGGFELGYVFLSDRKGIFQYTHW
ncbi:MAG TPA: hypothetical protein ENI15_19980 [Spirochaetes bacterium]|nr:hypothetical protein [Spirochaetota bacterium]